MQLLRAAALALLCGAIGSTSAQEDKRVKLSATCDAACWARCDQMCGAKGKNFICDDRYDGTRCTCSQGWDINVGGSCLRKFTKQKCDKKCQMIIAGGKCAKDDRYCEWPDRYIALKGKKFAKVPKDRAKCQAFCNKHPHARCHPTRPGMCVCDVGWTLSMDSSECNVPYTRIDCDLNCAERIKGSQCGPHDDLYCMGPPRIELPQTMPLF